MVIQLRTSAGDTAYLNSQQIIGAIVPSLLDPNARTDCRIICTGGVMVSLTHEELNRVVEIWKTQDDQKVLVNVLHVDEDVTERMASTLVRSLTEAKYSI